MTIDVERNPTSVPDNPPRVESPSQDPGRRVDLARVPPRSTDARIAVLEDRMPRLEASMREGFEDLKVTCFMPMIARQDATAKVVDDLKREVDGVVTREKSVRWWTGKVVEKGSQVLSIAVFGWLWWNDSGLAAKISAWWFRIFF